MPALDGVERAVEILSPAGVGHVAGVVDRRVRLQAVGGEQTAEVILPFQVRELKCAGRNCCREIIVPVIVVCGRFQFRAFNEADAMTLYSPASSGDLNASAFGRGFARARGPLAGAIMFGRC